MRCFRTFLVAGGKLISILTLTASLSPAGDIKIVANSSVSADTISTSELRRVYLETKISLADGTHVEPVLENGGPAHHDFLQNYLGMSEDDLQTYYRTLLFTGKGSMPKKLGSDAEVVAYVARTRGAIGYVSSSANAEGVKTLAIADSSGAERKLITCVEPDYPDTLRHLNIGGTVRLRISISAKGDVQDVALLGGNPILAESAIAAVKKWVYAAGKGQTVSEVSLSFGTH
jgi:TonB family protein